MNALLNGRILGWFLVGIGAIQAIPLAMAISLGEDYHPFFFSAGAALIVGAALAFSCRDTRGDLRLRDSFLIVGLAWILASIFGAFPYVFFSVLHPIDAFFESVSGFTTTGTTVMAQIEAAPHSLLLWRAITQWLGGMGIIVFAIAIVPLLGIGGMQLFKAEIPGISVDKLRPRVTETARRLLFIYAAFTSAECIALWMAGMSAYDALCHSLTTVSTGGFSTRDSSVGAFGSAKIEWIIIAFMFLGGVNFALHYRVVSGQLKKVVEDVELRYFVGVILVSTLIVAWLLVTSDAPGASPLRTAMFQVVSIVTTAGYGTADFDTWPTLAGLVLLQLMILGGMAGSTSGGVKGLRVILGFRVFANTMTRIRKPRVVSSVKYAGQTVPADLVVGVGAFFIAYFGIAAAATAVVSLAGYDIVTSASAALTSIGNVGPGLGSAGPTETFAHFPSHVKLVLAACMVLGRLEIFTIIVLLQPGFWRR